MRPIWKLLFVLAGLIAAVQSLAAGSRGSNSSPPRWGIGDYAQRRFRARWSSEIGWFLDG